MNYGHLIIVVSSVQGFFAGAFIAAATGSTYLIGDVGLIGLGGAIVGAGIPFFFMSMFNFGGE